MFGGAGPGGYPASILISGLRETGTAFPASIDRTYEFFTTDAANNAYTGAFLNHELVGGPGIRGGTTDSPNLVNLGKTDYP
ncbi:hypothetical protein GCM10023155_29550 [Bremerella cremea]